MPAIRPSACPGLMRVVATKDGGLCRVRLPGGRLDARAARALAAAARTHASGALDATNRANLQIRGVRAGREAALAAALIDAGLGPLPDGGADLTTAALRDDLRNVMLSPAAGRDPGALADTRSLGAALLAMLQTEPRFAALSPKCSLLLDGGERLAALDHPHDLWFAALRDAAGELRYAFGLAGSPPVAAGAAPALATVAPGQVVAVAHALLLAFVEHAPADAKRLRDALAVLPADALLAHAAARLRFAPRRDAALAGWRRTAAEPLRRFGVQPETDPATRQVGAQVPLGRLDAATLDALAALAERHGDGSLRFTPWQSVLLPGVRAAAAEATLAALAALGLIDTAAAPLAHLVACAGSRGCGRALADTKADALALAARLAAPAEAHLSGCARACAQPWPAAATLVAVEAGRYDLYRRDGEAGFGRLAARHLTIDQAAPMLDAPRRSQD
ncbi:precorrin-3B synthase [Burkholderia glumae AU6208]|nr:precorrin-3B synthase [Burkholderia glumae AU6208]QHE11909.1 precorrin-3B synthase [Burkholderia glumae AU6208]